MKKDYYPKQYAKNNSKGLKTNVIFETIKFLEENIDGKLADINVFL